MQPATHIPSTTGSATAYRRSAVRRQRPGRIGGNHRRAQNSNQDRRRRSYRLPQFFFHVVFSERRQKHRKYSPAVSRRRTALHTDRAVVFINNTFAHPEAQASSNVLLGREKW